MSHAGTQFGEKGPSATEEKIEVKSNRITGAGSKRKKELLGLSGRDWKINLRDQQSQGKPK
jgi:hypothetical protein